MCKIIKWSVFLVVLATWTSKCALSMPTASFWDPTAAASGSPSWEATLLSRAAAGAAAPPTTTKTKNKQGGFGSMETPPNKRTYAGNRPIPSPFPIPTPSAPYIPSQQVPPGSHFAQGPQPGQGLNYLNLGVNYNSGPSTVRQLPLSPGVIQSLVDSVKKLCSLVGSCRPSHYSGGGCQFDVSSQPALGHFPSAYSPHFLSPRPPFINPYAFPLISPFGPRSSKPYTKEGKKGEDADYSHFFRSFSTLTESRKNTTEADSDLGEDSEQEVDEETKEEIERMARILSNHISLDLDGYKRDSFEEDSSLRKKRSIRSSPWPRYNFMPPMSYFPQAMDDIYVFQPNSHMYVSNAAPPPPPPYEYNPEKCDCNCNEAASTPDGYENEQGYDGFQTDDLGRSGSPFTLEDDDNDVNNSDSVDGGQQYGNGTTTEGGYEEKNRTKRSTIGYGGRYGHGINPHYLYSTLAHHYNKHYGRYGSLGHYGGYGGYGRGYGRYGGHGYGGYGGFGHHRGYGGYGHLGGYGGYGHYGGYGKHGY